MGIKNTNNRKRNSSFTLLETMIAITILSFTILGPMELASKSIQSVMVFSRQTTASYLAQEAVEFIRNIRDTNFIQGNNWLAGLNQCFGASGCYVDIPTYFLSGLSAAISSCGAKCPFIKYDAANGYYYNYAVGQNTIFRRKVKITKINLNGNEDEARIDVTVSWKERDRDNSFVVEEDIFNWK